MKFFRKAAAFLLGLTFFVSGILKLMDSVGAGFVVRAWLSFLNLAFLGALSEFIGVIFALAEAFLGAALLSRVWKKIAAVACFIMTGFFTILTVLLVIFNPEMDCGCFGEVVHLTHWQSLLKNVVLLGLCCAAFLPLKNLQPRPGRVKYASFALAVASIVLFTIYSAFSVPLVDFGPFKPGTELIHDESEDIDYDGADSPFDESLTFFDFNLDYRDSIAVTGDVMVISIYDTELLPQSYWEALPDFVAKCNEAGFRPLVLVCADPDEFASEMQDARVLSNVYFADYKTLATLNRSNGGAVVIRDGQIVRKWARRALPGRDDMAEAVSAEPVDYQLRYTRASSIRLQAFWLYSAAVLLLL